MNLKIFVAHRIDKKSEILDDPIFYNINTGSCFDKSNENDKILHRDDIGDNISHKKEKYSEFTVQYWAWKNMDLDYYGLCHYRRYMSFSDKKYPTDPYSSVITNNLQETKKLFCLDEKSAENTVKGYDIILTEPYDVKNECKNLYEQYSSSNYLFKKDLDMAVNIIKKKYPEIYPYAEKYLKGTLLYTCNLFIMKKNIFFEYNKWLFSILEELETLIDFTYYSENSIRTIGHIGERLLGVYYIYLLNTRNIKSKLVQRSFIISDIDRFEYPTPISDKNNISVFFASNNYYVPYLATTIQSVIETANDDNTYDLNILHTEISRENQKKIFTLIKDKSNFNLRFINVYTYVYNLNLTTNLHPRIETFYKLAAHKIFKNYEKIVYLDCDIIVRKDIAQLYNENIGDSLIAGVIDTGVISPYMVLESTKKRLKNVLKLKNPYNYVNAGVLIFNLTQFNKTFTKDELINSAEDRKYFLMDQDILNSFCQDKIHIIDMRWNVMHYSAFLNQEIIMKTPAFMSKEYFASREDPYIIHFVGNSKPWDCVDTDMAEYFWAVARNTSFYEIILLRCVHNSNISFKSNFKKQFKIKIKNIAKILCPRNTYRRKIALQIRTILKKFQ